MFLKLWKCLNVAPAYFSFYIIFRAFILPSFLVFVPLIFKMFFVAIFWQFFVLLFIFWDCFLLWLLDFCLLFPCFLLYVWVSVKWIKLLCHVWTNHLNTLLMTYIFLLLVVKTLVKWFGSTWCVYHLPFVKHFSSKFFEPSAKRSE